ncbi:MAG: hypothetical protein QXD89_00540 [Candidatus Aenigmatarchaeota archaeon]
MSSDKESYFIECVKKAAKSLGLKYLPKVKVWEGACPYSDGNEIAHAHPDLGLICISRGRLESMTLDEIRETAFHETTHMLHIDHDANFNKSMNDAHLLAWLDDHKPGDISLKLKRGDENKVDKERCNYHLCRKKTKLYRCKYCGGYFCKDHIRPGLALQRSAIDNIKDPILRDKIYEEWRRTDRHPDIVWTRKYWRKLKLKEEETKEKFFEMLDKLKEKEMRERSKFIPGVSISSIRNTLRSIPNIRKSSFRFRYYREYTDPLVWVGLVICLISLFLPWVSYSLFGFVVEGSWFTLFKSELPKIEAHGLLNYIKSSHYVAIAISILSLLGFVIVIVGLLTRNWITFIGSLFMFFSPLVILYFFSEGVSIFGITINLVSLAGIGLWGFLIGSFLLAYGSGKRISGLKIFSSLIFTSIVVVLLLSNFSLFSGLKIEQQIIGYSYPNREVKLLIEKTIREYINEKYPWGEQKHTINDLIYFGPSFLGKSFNGYNICATGTYTCNYGKERGENINYLYCRPAFLSYYIFCYRKTIISTSGEIQNVIRNCVYNFVLNPKTLEVVSIEFGPLHQMAEGLC